jgi:hypothetical protein
MLGKGGAFPRVRFLARVVCRAEAEKGNVRNLLLGSAAGSGAGDFHERRLTVAPSGKGVVAASTRPCESYSTSFVILVGVGAGSLVVGVGACG